MMNSREKIIAYIDDGLNEKEKIQFEKELGSDKKLSEEFNSVKKKLDHLKSTAEPDTDETYFINLLPQFYLNKSKKKKFVFSKIAYSLSTAVAIILIMFIIFKPGTSNDFPNLTELSSNITEQELDETLNQYSDQYTMDDLLSNVPTGTDSLVNNMVAKELELSNNSIDKSVADQYLNTDDLLSSLNDKEINELYSQLANEDFINGAK